MKPTNTLSELDRAKFMAYLKTNRSNKFCLCIELLLRSGMRTEELTRINVFKDIYISHASIFIKAAKGSNDRYVPVDLGLLKYIQNNLTGNLLDNFGLKKPTFKRTLARHFDRIKLKALGIGYRDLTLHGLRAAFAQAVYVNCEHDIMLVKDLLGHKHLSNTILYMTGLTFVDKYEKIRKVI